MLLKIGNAPKNRGEAENSVSRSINMEKNHYFFLLLKLRTNFNV